MDLNIGFLASGGGTNVAAILRNIKEGNLDAKAQVIISNRSQAGVFEVAKNYGVPALHLGPKKLAEQFDDTLLDTLDGYHVNFIVLAGYLVKISPRIIKAYPNRIINIHPSLLPKYGGEGMYGHAVHDAVIASQDTESGATIHLVDERYDHGRTLAQIKVPRFENDTADSLAKRVLAAEHAIYFATLRDIQEERISLDQLK